MAIETKKPTTAIARFDDVRQAMAEYTPDKYISLIPTVDMERSPLYRPATMVVPVDPEDLARDVYKSPANDGTVCLRARKLEQLGNAIGVRWLDVKMSYPDDKRVTATVYAEFTDAVGDRIPLVAAATEFVTPTKGRSVSTYPDEKAQARARAILVKKLTGLPTSFAPAELKAKSFAGLRWILDDSQPDIREAIINRGDRAARETFGREAPQKAIDAGHAQPDDVAIDTTARPTEPEIPDAKPETVDEIPGIVAAIVSASSKGGDVTPATEDYLLTLGTATRDLFGLTSGKDAGVVLRAIGQLVFGDPITSWRSFNQAQTKTLVAMTKEPDGQVQLRKLLARAQQTDESLAAVKFPAAKKAAA